MARTTYADTPAGRARAHRDKQDRRLRDHGHSMAWRGVSRSAGRPTWRGTCRKCGGQLECHQYGAQWLSPVGPPSLLKWMGVNIIARCPGKR